MATMTPIQRCAQLETENLHLRDEIDRLRERMADFERLVELLRELLGVQ